MSAAECFMIQQGQVVGNRGAMQIRTRDSFSGASARLRLGSYSGSTNTVDTRKRYERCEHDQATLPDFCDITSKLSSSAGWTELMREWSRQAYSSAEVATTRREEDKHMDYKRLSVVTDLICGMRHFDFDNICIGVS